MRYAIILVITLVVAIACLLLSTSIDNILIEHLLVACTIVFSTIALKAAAARNVPSK